MRKHLLNILFKNFWYKALSLGLALIIWGIIQGEQVLELNREILVHLKVPEGYMIRGDSTRVLTTTIKGPRVLMLEATKKLEISLDVPALKGRRHRVRIDPRYLKTLNARLKVKIHDPYFYVFIDEKASRTVPIRYIPHGSPAEGYFVKKYVLNPRTAKITGLKADLMKIHDVVTEPVDISGLKENQTFEVAVIPPAGILSQNVSADKTVVTLKVGDSFVNQRFGSIPIEVIGTELPFSLRPKYASIVIQGTPGVLKLVSPEDLKAFIDARDLEAGRFEKEIQVQIPADTVLIESFPHKSTLILGSEAAAK